ncbi:non-ribosomal peptide synthetase [Actinomadura viridis]|uniref:Amino acid adenylation domain-containing protein n=1 Tax=Actinomadura viridis TaxID=58110 RepID=A0A931DNH9_9ACTN|nr:non-ribosomal peptide synthetase [Actinomadura viridis]MBG6090375.1 amino acid adenylation domain-containing protein [Actinomadura viridis]
MPQDHSYDRPERPFPPPAPDSPRLVTPLSFQQELLWPDGGRRPVRAAVRVRGPFRADRLRGAVAELVWRHEILRTTCREVDGRPRQETHPATTATTAAAVTVSASAAEAAAGAREPFDLGRLPLVRWTVTRLGPEDHEIVLEAHPAILDGRCAVLLLRQAAALYGGGEHEDAGAAGAAAAPRVQYGDYAVWQRDSLSSPAMRARLARLRRVLADPPPPLDLPGRSPDTGSAPGADGAPGAPGAGGAPGAPGADGTGGGPGAGYGLVTEELPAGLMDALREFGRAGGTSPFAVAFAGFAALLHRYSGATDLCVTTPWPKAPPEDVPGLLGAFTDPVALRCDLGGDPPFRELARRAGAAVGEARGTRHYPYYELARLLTRRGRGTLAQATFTLEDTAPADLAPLRFGDAAGTFAGPVIEPAGTALNVLMTPDALLWEYDRAAFDGAMAGWMAHAHAVLLRAALAAPSTRLSRLPLLGGARRGRVVDELSGRRAAPRPSAEETAPVHVLVGEQARRTPSAVALSEGGRSLTYGDLDAYAGRVAAGLLRLGTRPEQVVGVLLPRGADLAVAELGVLKSGAAYLPLDPDHPAERLAFLCRDAGVAHVVTAGGHASRVPAGTRALTLEDVLGGPSPEDAPPAAEPSPHDLAYVMYTSGSTGRPKGVAVEHGALANFTRWYRTEYGLAPGDRQAMVNAAGFDASVIDLWPALTAGAGVRVADPGTRLSPDRLRAWLIAERIASVFLTTALAEPLLALSWPGDVRLRVLQTGGEVFRARPDPALPFRVDLAYGPTEGTVFTTVGTIAPAAGPARAGAPPGAPPDTPPGAPPDIGVPIAGAVVHVLDEAMRPVPPGVRGELYLGGPGLARGYLARPALTAERFVPDPFTAGPGGRLYRTGDVVRLRPDGRLDFVGRTDAQVKLRGNRIEPGEIESVLCRHPAIGRAHVAVRDDGPGGDRRLVAYLVARDGQETPASAEVRRHLERDLPAFMIPSTLVPLDRLPLTANGKVDAAALPAPGPPAGAEPDGPAGAREPPVTPTEDLVAGIWSAVLGLPEVGVADNFFDLGGHSLLVHQVRERLVERLGHGPPILDFFQYPTVRALARHIDGGPRDGAAAGAAADRSGARAPDGRRRGLARLERRRARRTDTEGTE